MSEVEHTMALDSSASEEMSPESATSAQSAVEAAEVEPERTVESAVASEPVHVYQGNGYDIAALLAAVLGGVALLSCGTLGYFIYCLPLLPLAVGVVALLTTRRAVDPQRSRVLSWVGVGAGAVTTLALIVGFLLWVAAVLVALAFSVLMAFSQSAGGVRW